jgi:hypothetical protein
MIYDNKYKVECVKKGFPGVTLGSIYWCVGDNQHERSYLLINDENDIWFYPKRYFEKVNSLSLKIKVLRDMLNEF